MMGACQKETGASFIEGAPSDQIWGDLSTETNNDSNRLQLTKENMNSWLYTETND